MKIVTCLILCILSLTITLIHAQESKVIYMPASMVGETGKGGWNPTSIIVQKGTEVTLKLESLDMTHTLSIPAYNINKDIIAGHPTEITFVADKIGVFHYSCSMYCGDYHYKMVGQLIVQ